MQLTQTLSPTLNLRRLVGAAVSAVLGYHPLWVLRPVTDLNLRELHDRWYGEPQAGDAVKLNLLAVVGSSSTGTPAFDTGFWPAGVEIEVYNSGTVSGKGGVGGWGGEGGSGTTSPGNAGGAGGLALRVTVPVKVHNGGTIQGGGGGGGGGAGGFDTSGGGGGGGGGRVGGAGGVSPVGWWTEGGNGSAGTLTTGGAGGASAFSGGAGGAPAQPGASGVSSGLHSGGAGGAPGAAIQGISYITWIDADGNPTANQGTILGAIS